MLWSSLSSRNAILDAPVSLELHAAKPSQKSALRQTKKIVSSPSLEKDTDSFNPLENSVSATQSGASEETMGSTRTTYLSELRNFIERYKSYPPQARTLGHEGQAEVRFSILSDGTLSSIELLRSSGSSILDQAALSLLQRVQKLAPIPIELRMTQLDLVLPIQYSLN
jgi:protein TonB